MKTLAILQFADQAPASAKMKLLLIKERFDTRLKISHKNPNTKISLTKAPGLVTVSEMLGKDCCCPKNGFDFLSFHRPPLRPTEMEAERVSGEAELELKQAVKKFP